MAEGAVITIDLSMVIVIGFSLINLMVLGPIAWIVKGLIDDTKEISHDLTRFKQEASREFVRDERYIRDIDEMKRMLGKMFDKLDTLAGNPKP